MANNHEFPNFSTFIVILHWNLLLKIDLLHFRNINFLEFRIYWDSICIFVKGPFIRSLCLIKIEICLRNLLALDFNRFLREYFSFFFLFVEFILFFCICLYFTNYKYRYLEIQFNFKIKNQNYNRKENTVK